MLLGAFVDYKELLSVPGALVGSKELLYTPWSFCGL